MKQTSDNKISRVQKPTAFPEQLRGSICYNTLFSPEEALADLTELKTKKSSVQDPGGKCISCSDISKK